MQTCEIDPSQMTLARWERFCFGMLELTKRRGVERYVGMKKEHIRDHAGGCVLFYPI